MVTPDRSAIPAVVCVTALITPPLAPITNSTSIYIHGRALSKNSGTAHELYLWSGELAHTNWPTAAPRSTRPPTAAARARARTRGARAAPWARRRATATHRHAQPHTATAEKGVAIASKVGRQRRRTVATTAGGLSNCWCILTARTASGGTVAAGSISQRVSPWRPPALPLGRGDTRAGV
jgi:hypothetical protein